MSEKTRVGSAAKASTSLTGSDGDNKIVGMAANGLGSLTEVADRGETVADTNGLSPWSDVVGEVTTPGATAEMLGISRQSLDRRRNAGAVLGIQTSSGRWVYPLAQFRSSGDHVEVHPALQPVLTILLDAADGLGAARWLDTPNRRLDGDRPWDTIGDESTEAALLDAAKAQAAAWLGRPPKS